MVIFNFKIVLFSEKLYFHACNKNTEVSLVMKERIDENHPWVNDDARVCDGEGMKNYKSMDSFDYFKSGYVGKILQFAIKNRVVLKF